MLAEKETKRQQENKAEAEKLSQLAYLSTTSSKERRFGHGGEIYCILINN